MAVVHSVPRTPRVLEIIAVFFEAERARDYADRENSRSAEPATEPTEALTRRSVEPTVVTSELSSRQSAVLGALRSTMAKTAMPAILRSIPSFSPMRGFFLVMKAHRR